MIKRIFLDLDECLIHTCIYTPLPQDVESISFTLEKSDPLYKTAIHPQAKKVIELCRSVVGNENVYILTASTKLYSNTINKLAKFEFREDQIFSREDIKRHSVTAAYNGTYTLAAESIADKNNILIDNLYPRENASKMNMIGINSDNYLKVDDYYADERDDTDSFYEKVLNFINKKNEKDNNNTSTDII